MRLRIALLAACGAVLLVPSGASAAFHLMKVREVFPGTTANPDAQFIELQMHAAGQNLVGGHEVTAFGPAGDEGYPLDTNVSQGGNQRTILLASPEAEALFGVTADFPIEKLAITPASGAVCFETFDCVSWGGYSFAGSPSSPVGANAPAIPDGSSLERTIAPGCPTLLEAGDDTDDGATDFATAAPSPRNNATAPTETGCVQPPPDDTTVAGAKLTAKGKQEPSAKKPKVLAKASLGEDGKVTVVGKAKVGGKTYKLRKGATLTAGKKRKMVLKAKGMAKRKIGRALNRGRTVRTKLTATFTDDAGNTAKRKKTVKLK